MSEAGRRTNATSINAFSGQIKINIYLSYLIIAAYRFLIPSSSVAAVAGLATPKNATSQPRRPHVCFYKLQPEWRILMTLLAFVIGIDDRRE